MELTDYAVEKNPDVRIGLSMPCMISEITKTLVSMQPTQH